MHNSHTQVNGTQPTRKPRHRAETSETEQTMNSLPYTARHRADGPAMIGPVAPVTSLGDARNVRRYIREMSIDAFLAPQAPRMTPGRTVVPSRRPGRATDLVRRAMATFRRTINRPKAGA